MDDLSRQGIEHFNGGRFDQALRCFRAAIAAGADGPETRCLLAHALDGAGSPQKAATEFAAALKVFPRHLPAYAGLANLLLRRGALPGAVQALGRSLRLKPVGRDGRRKLIETLRLCALAWRAAGEPRAAEKALNRAFALDPKNPESRRQVVETLRLREEAYRSERNRRLETLRLREEAYRSERNRRLEALRQRGANGDDLELQEKSLRKALAMAPRDPESRRLLLSVLRRRALAHLAGGKLESAEKEARKALNFEPADKESKRLLLEVLHARAASTPDTLALAEKTLRKALALAPRDAETRRRLLDVLRHRALADLTAGKLEFAQKAACKAADFAPGDKESKRLLLEVLHMRSLAAQSQLKDARVKKAEKVRSLLEQLKAAGQAYKPATRARKAKSLLVRILKIDPVDARAYLIAGAVLFSCGATVRGRALLDRALRLDRGALAPGDRFSALMKLGRYKAAVAAAERILDGAPTLADLRAFWDPWEWDDRPERGRRQALAAFSRALGPRAKSAWLPYYRADLRGPDELRHLEELALFSKRRYGWMLGKAGLAALCAGRFPQAEAWLRGALGYKTSEWRTRGFLAEALLCQGRRDEAFAEMERARRAAPADEAGQVVAWRGAFDLWLGRYDEAVRRCDEALRLGAPYAQVWKAGALLKLDRPREALKQLDEALALYPRDLEAYVWRGEAKRALGMHREALKDLNEPALAGAGRATPIWLWALFNRALVKGALGDRAGLKADFDAIPESVMTYIRGKTRSDEMVPLLEAGLVLARGFRREEYKQAIWMI